MNQSDFKRLNNLNLDEKKRVLKVVEHKLSCTNKVIEIKALETIQYNLNSAIKDLQITACLDEVL